MLIYETECKTTFKCLHCLERAKQQQLKLYLFNYLFIYRNQPLTITIRTRLQHCRRSQKAEMLLDQSVM